MLIQNEVQRHKILLGTLVFACITIPLFNNLNSIALILLVAACLLQRPAKEWKTVLSGSAFWVLPVVYFIWITLTWFWDTSGGFTIKQLERYAILLFIPPSMAIIPKLPAKYVKIICFSMVVVTIVIGITCLLKSYAEYQQTGDYRVFYYHYLGQQMKLNAIFLSNYCFASIVWLLYYGDLQKRKDSFLILLLIMISIAFLLLMIFLLSSKLIILLTIAMLVASALYYGYRKRSLVVSVLLMAVIIAGGVLAIGKPGYLNWRFATTELKKYQGTGDDNNGIAIRLLMWETGWELIREKPLLGHGLKGARDETVEQYRKKHFTMGYEQKYHTHNQYIESTLMGGIPALVLLLSILVMAVTRALRTHNLLLLLMVVHFICQSVIESTFEVQQELVFFLFFIFLFYYHPPLQTKKS